MRVVRAGAGFRVILHAEERQRLVAQSFECVVVQVDVCQVDFVGVDRVWIDSEVVVMR